LRRAKALKALTPGAFLESALHGHSSVIDTLPNLSGKPSDKVEITEPPSAGSVSDRERGGAGA